MHYSGENMHKTMLFCIKVKNMLLLALNFRIARIMDIICFPIGLWSDVISFFKTFTEIFWNIETHLVGYFCNIQFHIVF